MKATSFTHVYEQFRNTKETSEQARIQEIDHFRTRISHEVFSKTYAEKAELATRMRNYPNKNHRPVPPNN